MANFKKQTLFSIAPHAPFLETLANNILNGNLVSGFDISTPFALSDITIILPTKRARLELAGIFKNKLNGGVLLPNIITFGDQNQEDTVFLPPYDEEALPKAISNIKRSLILAKLVETWAKNNQAQKLQTAQIMNLATSLAQLIDSCYIENIDYKNLKNIAPQNLAKNWQQTLDFLLIALEAWPKILAFENKIDAVNLRNIQLLRQAKAAEKIFNNRPVIAAGSTGSVLATAKLLKSIAQLPRGKIVLPGLDLNLEEKTLFALRNITNNPHGHTQYSLVKLLSFLGAVPADVQELAKNNNWRTNIIRNALALTDDSANWADLRQTYQPKINKAFENISIINASCDEQQARAIALACLDGLNNKKTIGIISPDRNFARRIAAELKRFDINVDDSAGTPLFHTRAGRFARQILAVVKNEFYAVDLISLLRNKYTLFGFNRANIAELTDLLEYALLRSQRLNKGIDGLRIGLQKNLSGVDKHAPFQLSQAQGEKLFALFDKIEQIFTPLITLFENKKFFISQFANIFSELILALLENEDEKRQIKDDMKLLIEWLDNLKSELGSELGISLSSFDIEASLNALMASISYRPKTSFNDKIAIWGLLEARLQNPDLLILAGLNENIWPNIADPGPWLSRNMAIEAGLEPPEKRVGQAAHDFEMAMGNENVIISYSKNIGTIPAQISRFLQRIEAFITPSEIKKCQTRGNIWLKQALALDHCVCVRPATRPSPNPEQKIRPKNLSVTEIETLVRSPYDIYAKYVLKLKPLDALGSESDARDRGNIIHAIFEQFIDEKIDINAINAHENLMSIAKQHFSKNLSNASLETLWLTRFEKIAQEFIKFEKARDENIYQRNSEVSGQWQLPGSSPIFTLRGKADRIDITKEQTIEILDYKTGAVPLPKDMRDFLAPQMLLEAAMAREGAFEKIAPKPISNLTYIKIAFGPDAFKVSDFLIDKDSDLDQAIDEIIRRLSTQVNHYLLSDKLPMSARIFPSPKQTFKGAYEHLARTGEWSLIDIVEEE